MRRQNKRKCLGLSLGEEKKENPSQIVGQKKHTRGAQAVHKRDFGGVGVRKPRKDKRPQEDYLKLEEKWKKKV